MSLSLYILAGLFLPLFPLSMVFNQVLGRIRQSWQRGLLILLWPQIGVLIVSQAGAPVPDWFVAWALLTAALYAYRALSLNAVGLWIGFVATSAWALLWVVAAEPAQLYLQALGFSLPLALISLLTGSLEGRMGAAHTALGGGLGVAAPRLAGLFVVAVLAAVATPIFPGFFTMLATLIGQAASAPIAALVLVLVWLLWTWSGARLLHGILVGPAREISVEDMSTMATWGYATGFVVLALVGIKLGGVLL
jgi:NADH:ubiquinone oxidoreductase subunit 4 (subunit M)